MIVPTFSALLHPRVPNGSVKRLFNTPARNTRPYSFDSSIIECSSAFVWNFCRNSAESAFTALTKSIKTGWSFKTWVRHSTQASLPSTIAKSVWKDIVSFRSGEPKKQTNSKKHLRKNSCRMRINHFNRTKKQSSFLSAAQWAAAATPAAQWAAGWNSVL